MGQMLEGIADPANLAFAWGKVRANAGADGAAWAADPAGQTIAAFESDAEYQLAALRCAPAGTGRSHPGAKVASRTGDSASVLQLGPLVMRWCNRYDVSTG